MENIDPVMLMYRNCTAIDSVIRAVIASSTPLLSVRNGDRTHFVWGVNTEEVWPVPFPPRESYLRMITGD